MSTAIIEKIKKLLELSKSANEHEAAAAAAKAQELIYKFEIDAAELKSGPQAVEEITVDQEKFFPGRKIPFYLKSLAAISRSYFCRSYSGDGGIFIMGTVTNRETFKLMFNYLRAEIERISRQGWENLEGWQQENSSQTKWINSFRAGCVSTVLERLRQNTNQLTGTPAPDGGKNPAALVMVSKQAAISIFIKSIGLRLVASSPGRVSDGSGYGAGRAAGHSINLSTRQGVKQIG
jgi:hypothetical protein